MTLRVFAVLMLIVSCLGCAAQKFKMKAYDEPELAADKVALLKPYLGTIIESIDGNTKYAIRPMRPGLPNLDIDISLLPGEHQIVLRYELHGVNQYQWAKHDQSVRFNAIAGRRYLLNVTTAGDTWRPYVEDVTDHPEKWCWFESECDTKPASKSAT